MTPKTKPAFIVEATTSSEASDSAVYFAGADPTKILGLR
jgi:hypothetical protein